VFDNHGVRVPPTPVVLVEDPSGKVLIDNRAPKGTQALDPVVADNVTNVLKGVITQPGATAYGTANIGRPAAGKTGTTSSYVDAWFVGYTPTLVTSVWMGRKNTEDPNKGASMNSVCSVGRHTCASPVFGGTLPAMTWADYMKQAMQGVPPTDFNQPAPLTPVADALDAQLRRGISPGAQRAPVSVGDGGPYVQGPAPPVAVAPTTTSTTSTTVPPARTRVAGPRQRAGARHSRMIRLLLVDDEAMVRTGLRLILETEDDLRVVGEAATGYEAIDQAGRLQPDVVLMDVRMPRMDGVEACRRLVETSDAKVVILTTFDLDEHLFAAVRAGACGFLLKASPPEELVTAIRAAHAGNALVEPRMTRRLLDEFARRPAMAPAGQIPALLNELTERELDVLREMARGLSNVEIGQHLYIGEATVKTHVTHILAKLGLRDRIQAVVLAYESGLVEPGR